MGEVLAGWEELAFPVGKGLPRGDSVSMTAKVKVDGYTWLDICFSKSLAERFGKPTQCRVRAGVGENVGKVRIWFDADGPTRVTQMGKLGFMRVILPAPSWFEAGVREKVALTFGDDFDGAITLNLSPSRPKKPEPVRAGGGANEPVDVAQTLVGRDVRKLAGGRWQIDGDAYAPEAVLLMVNKQRAKGALGPVRVTQLV
jgi:hypothetical protein